MQWMEDQRIAGLTYHKSPGENWPEDEFQPHAVTLASGQRIVLPLAERGTRLSNGLWVREIRKLTDRGHQTALLATDDQSALGPAAVAMFARWSQENFFKYARQHYGLDRLVDYGTEPISDPTPVVNPACFLGAVSLSLYHRSYTQRTWEVFSNVETRGLLLVTAITIALLALMLTN
jgi:hypothetical protein